MKDALNQEIIIGNNYGYTSNRNGFTHIVFGKACKITDKGCTLDIILFKTALYDDEPKIVIDHAKKINVKSIHLFPINIED